MVNLSAKPEVTDSRIFQHAVVVHSDQTISVQALNAKPNTGEVTLLRPVGALGRVFCAHTSQRLFPKCKGVCRGGQ